MHHPNVTLNRLPRPQAPTMVFVELQVVLPAVLAVYWVEEVPGIVREASEAVGDLVRCLDRVVLYQELPLADARSVPD